MAKAAGTLVLALVLAGCTSGDASTTGDAPGGGAVATASGIPLEDAGSIEGIVVDDAQNPLFGASVAIVALVLEATTDEAGQFRLHNLAPGTYVVNAGMLGYDSVARKVDVVAHEVTPVTLMLQPIAIEEAYHDTFGPFNGYFSCQVGTPQVIRPCLLNADSTVFPDDKKRFTFNLTADHWTTIVGESRWQQGTFATSPGMAIYMSHNPDGGGNHWWCEADGQSPILFRLEREGDSVCSSVGPDNDPPEPTRKFGLFIAADPGFAGTSLDDPPVRLMLQQKFEVMATIFYGDPGPVDFSAFPDT